MGGGGGFWFLFFFSWRDSVDQCGFLIYVYVCIYMELTRLFINLLG